MAIDRKMFFIDELKAHYQEIISVARKAELESSAAADDIRREARNKEDAKGAVESGRMASGHRTRRLRATRELERLVRFASGGGRALGPTARVALGAMVDVSIQSQEGSEERTLFVLPVGAGTQLNGPGGDGFISVIGLDSPVGRALEGATVDDEVEVIVQGTDREWTVVDVC